MAEQRVVAARHQHDHGGIGAREMLRLAGGADHHVAGAAHIADAAADAAEPVPCAPVHQAARMRQHRRLWPRHAPADRAQIDELAQLLRQQRHRVVRRADVHREHRLLVVQAEERPGTALHAQRVRHLAGDEHRLRRAFVHAAHQVAVAPYRHEQRLRIVQPLFDPGGILAPRPDAVERAGGIDVRTAGQDQGHGKRSRLWIQWRADRAMRRAERQPPADTEPSSWAARRGRATEAP